MHGGDLGECLSWVRAATRLSIYPSICRLIGSDFFTSDETRRETFDRSFTFQIGSDPTPAEGTDPQQEACTSRSRPVADTHGSKARAAMLFYLALLTTTAVAFTPGSKPAPKSNRAATNNIVSSNICGYEFPALPEPASAPGRPIWFEVAAQPANPDLSCYETGDGWLCAYDTDIKLEIDAEDSY